MIFNSLQADLGRNMNNYDMSKFEDAKAEAAEDYSLSAVMGKSSFLETVFIAGADWSRDYHTKEIESLRKAIASTEEK